MADSTIPNLIAVTTPVGTDLFAVRQSGDTRDKKMTRAQIHALVSGEHLVIPMVNEPATPTLAFGDGDTGFYMSIDGLISTAHNGAAVWGIAPTTLGNTGGNRILMSNAVMSATSPGLRGAIDSNSGVAILNDLVHLICGGLEAARFEDPADLAAAETSLWLYDDDNGQMEQVTVGAADSGGSGFKVLRIAN